MCSSLCAFWEVTQMLPYICCDKLSGCESATAQCSSVQIDANLGFPNCFNSCLGTLSISLYARKLSHRRRDQYFFFILRDF